MSNRSSYTRDKLAKPAFYVGRERCTGRTALALDATGPRAHLFIILIVFYVPPSHRTRPGPHPTPDMDVFGLGLTS